MCAQSHTQLAEKTLNWGTAPVDAEEIKIDAGENGLADVGDGGAQLRCILGDQLRGDDLLVGSIGSEHIRRSRLNDLHDLLRRVGGLHQDVGDGAGG